MSMITASARDVVHSGIPHITVCYPQSFRDMVGDNAKVVFFFSDDLKSLCTKSICTITITICLDIQIRIIDMKDSLARIRIHLEPTFLGFREVKQPDHLKFFSRLLQPPNTD